MKRVYVLGTESGQLVRAFETEDGILARKRLGWLVFFVARRVLPCWELYCDGDKPQRTVAALKGCLATGHPSRPAWRYTIGAMPSYQGVVFADCRFTDTMSASDTAEAAARYLRSGDLFWAACALSNAYMAFDTSALGRQEKFVPWLLEIAVPAAWECRELTSEEQQAYRDFDPSSLPALREEHHRRRHTIGRFGWRKHRFALLIILALVPFVLMSLFSK